jgi:hypothetical protein
VTITATAYYNPHLGEPITLKNTTAKLAVPKDLIQTGVDLGIITDGAQIPSQVTLVMNGTGTTQGTKTFNVSSTATVDVGPPTAEHPQGVVPGALIATVALPNSTWTPVDDTTPVIFSEKSVTIVASIVIKGAGAGGSDLTIKATFACAATSSPAVVAVSSQGEEVVVTTTTIPGAVGPEGSTTTTVATTAAAGSDSLPRTGGSTLLLLALAAFTIDIGMMLTGATRRKFERAE